MRLDKWLVCARFVKTRSLAQKVCSHGKLYVNDQRVTKSHFQIAVGQQVQFEYAGTLYHIEVLALAERRGPASEAQALYKLRHRENCLASENLSTPIEAETSQQEAQGRDRRKREALFAQTPIALREQGAGRPTKAERRALQKLRVSDL